MENNAKMIEHIFTFQLIADLSSSRTKTGGYFLISSSWGLGSDRNWVEDYTLKVDLYLSSSKVTSRKKFTQHINNATERFYDNDEKGPISIILIYGNLPELKLTPENPYIDLKDNCRIFKQIKATIIDMTIISHYPLMTRVFQMYDELFPRWAILQQHSTTAGFISINRCKISQSKGLAYDQTANHQIGFVTPGDDNDCSGNIILPIEDLLIMNIFERTKGAHQHQILPAETVAVSKIPLCCQGSCQEITIKDGLAYREGQIIAEICCRGECHGTCVIDGQFYLLDFNINYLYGDINHCKTQSRTGYVGNYTDEASLELSERREPFDCDNNEVNNAISNETQAMQEEGDNEELGPKEYLFNTTRFFGNDTIDLVKRHQPNLPWRVLSRPENRFWVNYLFNSTNPSLSHLRCWICFWFWDGLLLNKHMKEGFAYEEGKLHTSYENNWSAIKDHPSSRGHDFIVSFMKENMVETVDQMYQILQNVRDQLLQATDHLFRTKYTTDKKYASFSALDDFIEMQRLNGAPDMGQHLTSPTTSGKLTDFIGSSLHHDLISFLKSNDGPISILVDESIIGHKNYLVVMLQGLENNGPQMWYYKTIHIKSATAQALFDAITQEWERDGLTEYFVKNLRGFGSDGASSMRGRFKGLFELLNDMVDNKLIGTWCYAHKLHVIGGWSLKTEPHFLYIEDLNNRVHGYYHNQGSKRKESLVVTAQELGEYLYSPGYVHQIRWVASERNAFVKLKKNWRALVQDLNKICNGETNISEKPAKNQACQLAHELSTRRFLINIHFYIDVLDELAIWSQELQISSDLLFDKERQRDVIIDKIHQMKCTDAQTCADGPELEMFKSEVKCWGETPQWIMSIGGVPQIVKTYQKVKESNCNEEDYDRAEFVEYKGFPLLPRTAGTEMPANDMQNVLPKLSDIRDATLDTLVEQIRSYFPHDSFLHAIRIFDPFEFPTDKNYIFSHWLTTSPDIETIGKTLVGHDQEYLKQVVFEWRDLLMKLKSLPQYDNLTKESANIFWTKILNNEDLIVGPNFKSLVEICLCLPVGTSSVERSFSILGKILTKSRNKLSPQIIDNIMRIIINGPPLNLFQPRKYSEKYVKDHIRADDPITVMRGRGSTVVLTIQI